jgi:chromate reductase
MAEQPLDVLVICGSLRKGSYNAALARMLPRVAPAGIAFRTAPSFAKHPIYDYDIQTASGFPAEINAWADAIRSADALIIVTPEYNWSIPGGEERDRLGVAHEDQPFKDKPVALQSAAGGILGGSCAISPAAVLDLRRCDPVRPS